MTIQEIQNNIDSLEERDLVKEFLESLQARSLVHSSSSGYGIHPLIKEYANWRLINRIFQNQNLKINGESFSDKESIIRFIEFPPEYREAGSSILMYFNHVLRLKYPDEQVKVKIEQDGLILRMIIDTPTGQKKSIERTLEEYGMVVVGQLSPEHFLNDPFEVMALKNKLEIAHLELRQARELINFTQNSSKKSIETLEIEVNRLHRLIERSLQSNNKTLGVIEKMANQEGKNYDLRGAKFGGGFATESGYQTGGNLVDVSSTNNLTEIASQIQELLQQLQLHGCTLEEAQQKIAEDLAKQAESDPSVMGKLAQWGKSLADTAGKTSVSEAAKAIVKIALKTTGIAIP